MRELLELQTGQVAFISGLMSGFALSIAAQILRYGIKNRRAQAIFVMFIACSFLFLIALYVDVRLSIELAGFEMLPQSTIEYVSDIRSLGTSCATVALVLFVIAIGSLGWLGSRSTGIITSFITLATMTCLWFVWSNINILSASLAGL